MRIALSIAACTLLSACPSTSVYRTATPVAVDHWRVGGGASLGGMSDQEQESRFPTADLELQVRRGLRENLDLGIKLYTAGSELNSTWRVYRGSWSIALAPALGGLLARESGFSPDAIHLFAQVHGIATRELSARWSLSMGPTSGWGLYWPETGGSEQGLWLGAFVNGEAKLGTRWRIVPELGGYRVLAGEVPVRGGAIRLGVGLTRDL